jgi:putative intracellular protease/amidase
MSGAIDVLNPDKPKRILMLASNAAVSEQTGWLIGFWWAELTHPYWEFVESGYEVEVASPEGGGLEGDKWSDPRDESKYSADDLISLGFINSPEHIELVAESKPLVDVRVDDYDALLAIGGQGPMYTFHQNEGVHALFRAFYEAGKPLAVICHATCALRDASFRRKPARPEEDLDRVRGLRRGLRQRVRGTEGPALPDRGGG